MSRELENTPTNSPNPFRLTFSTSALESLDALPVNATPPKAQVNWAEAMDKAKRTLAKARSTDED